MFEVFKKAKIIIVDDQESNIRTLERLLQRAGYLNVRSITDPTQVFALYEEFQPDLILLDLFMPELDGVEVMQELASRGAQSTYLPILVLTADMSVEAKQRALSSGARDFLTKPFDPVEVLLRISNLLEARFLHNSLKQHNDLLEERVEERTTELREAQVEIFERLALAAEYRDDDTGEHTQRVGRMAANIGKAVGMDPIQIELLRRAAPLHDVGKIGIPDAILLKPGKLTPDEFEQMKNHAAIGAKILSGSRFPLLRMAEDIALTHHEAWDGSGYPSQLYGEDIPLEARITTIADIFDALTHERPYKKPWTREEALAEILKQSSLKLDPTLVQVFATLLKEGQLDQEVSMNTPQLIHWSESIEGRQALLASIRRDTFSLT